jgi:hypothetical protein
MRSKIILTKYMAITQSSGVGFAFTAGNINIIFFFLEEAAEQLKNAAEQLKNMQRPLFRPT